MLWTTLSASESSVNTVYEGACTCIDVFKWVFMLWTRFVLLRGLYICVCVCIHIYIYVYMYVYIYTHIYTHTHIHTHIENGFGFVDSIIGLIGFYKHLMP